MTEKTETPTNETAPSKHISVAEIAKHFGKTSETIRTWLTEGKLDVKWEQPGGEGGDYIILRADWEARGEGVK